MGKDENGQGQEEIWRVNEGKRLVKRNKSADTSMKKILLKERFELTLWKERINKNKRFESKKKYLKRNSKS